MHGRRYDAVCRRPSECGARLSRLLKRTGLAPEARSHLLAAYAEELVGEDDPTALAAAREALDLATSPRLRAAAIQILIRGHRGLPERDDLCRELVAIGTEHDLPVYRVIGPPRPRWQ
ncbi:hypothetical protein ABT340_20300 [Streptosporangium sp. NPDC000239]|uniref:hypothetical protein n=1 Tax=Streptosporangium sp. NPDC000239 TaxID=3154248 RepID=UPI00332FBC95